MSATGKTPILLYGSTTTTNVPVAGNLTNSSDGCEIAINVADKNLFFKDSTNAVNTVPIRQSNGSSNGWLSSTDWTTFNNKAPALTYTTNYIPYGQGTTTPALSSLFTFDGTTLVSPACSLSSGNLTFNSTAQRITGDFSNATIANRLLFQTKTANNQTVIGIIPNGTANATAISLEGDSAVANGPTLQFICNVASAGTDSRIISGIRGTGTYLPVTLYTGGSERMRIDIVGNVGIGVTPATKLDVGGTGLDRLLVNPQSAGNGVSLTSVNASNNAYSPYTTNGSVSIFQTGGSESMRINSSGGVSIGNTTDPGATNLSVTGSIGIGATTTPNYLLDIQKSAASLIQASIYNSNASGSASYYLRNNASGSATGYGGYLQLDSTNGLTLMNQFGNPLFLGTNNTTRFTIDGSGNIYGANGATNMTNGFFYIPSAAGAPSGTPTSVSSHVPMYYDTTNNQFYVYNGAWKKVTLA